MIPEWLSPIVDRLAGNPSNRTLRNAVGSWMRELDLEVGDEGEAANLIVDLAHRLYAGARGRHLRNRVADKTPLVATLSESDFREGMKRMDTKDVVLVALAVTAVGYIVYRFTRQRQEPEKRHPPSPTPAVAERWVLVLVVNAGRSEILTALRTEGQLSPQLAEALYKATQALWIGTEADFERGPIRAWLDPARRVQRDSEYDVHLVKILVANDDAGFGRNATQMDRIDAFTRLAMSRAKADVSERLPSEAYGTTGVYSR